MYSDQAEPLLSGEKPVNEAASGPGTAKEA
jgi:hypothetical protein